MANQRDHTSQVNLSENQMEFQLKVYGHSGIWKAQEGQWKLFLGEYGKRGGTFC